MQHLVPSKNWYLIKAILSLAIAFLLLGTPQTFPAIYTSIIAKHDITLTADGSFVDSYSGSYNPGSPGDNGNIYSADGSAGAISIGNGDIYGFVTTGPGGTVYMGPEAGIGTHSWLSTNSGVEPGYIENFGVTGFPTVDLPYTNGPDLPPGGSVATPTVITNVFSVTNSPFAPPAPGPYQTIICDTNLYITTSNVIDISTNQVVNLISNVVCGTQTFLGSTLPPNCCSFLAVGHKYEYTLIVGTNVIYVTNIDYTYSTNVVYLWGTNYDYSIYTANLQTNYYDHVLCGNYCAATLSGATVVTCPSTLVLTNGLNQMGTDSITILAGASLSLYVDGGDVTIQAGGIINFTGVDTNLQTYCTPAVSSLSLDTTTPLSGEIIAPDTDISINGSGSAPVEFFGNIMANSLTANGVLHFHGDEAVRLPTAPIVFGGVASPPALLTAQTNIIAVVGWQVELSAVPAYSGMNLQWFLNGTNLIANATNFSLSLSNVTTDMTGQYTLQESAPGLLLVSQPAWLTVLTTPAATLDSFSISASNQFQFNVSGVPGYRYDVEGSSNLTDWTPLEFVLCPGPFTFTDTNQLGPQYFYRAKYLGP